MANNKLKTSITKVVDFENQKYATALDKMLDELSDFLKGKNRQYGNSLYAPLKIYNKGTALDAINARIDDKLARKRQDNGDEDEDIDRDLVGYLLTRMMIKRGLL